MRAGGLVGVSLAADLRFTDVRHLPDEIDDAIINQGNADEMVGKAAAP